MKKASRTIIVLIGFSLFFSCKKDIPNQEMTVIKNCTGTYLNFEGNDYQVCNTDKIDSFEDQTKVIASFTRIDDCAALEGKIICYMAFESEGLIEVQSIE